MSRTRSPRLTDAASDGGAHDAASWIVVQGTARVAIRVTRAPEAARYAPEAVWFEAVPEGFDLDPKPEAAFAYRPEFHQIEYAWEFGEPGDAFTAPQNVPDAFRDANTATGQITSHVYRSGGVKRVRCIARRVIDPETMEIQEAVAEVDIEVGDPDTLWSELNTVVVALDGDFSGAPPGSRATIVTDTEAEPWWSTPRHWLTQVNRLIGEGERSIRVLFKRGEAYPMSLYKPNTRAPHIARFMVFGAWGDPDRYRPTFPRLGGPRPGWSNEQPVVFEGVRAVHDYDPVTETGSTMPLMNHNEGGYALFTDVGFERAGSGALIQTAEIAPRAAPSHIFFHDCYFEALAAYGVFCYERPEDRVAYLGCRDTDIGSAPHGGDLDYGTGNSQGPLRIAALGDWVILGSDFFSRHGWTHQNNWPGTDIKSTAEQACMRVFAGGDSLGTGNGRVVVARCSGEGSRFLGAAALPDQRPPRGNLLIEQVIHVQSAAGHGFIDCECGAVTIRNGLWIKPNVPNAHIQTVLFFFLVVDRPRGLQPNQKAHLAEPIHIYNNTFVVLQPSDLRHGMFGHIDKYDNFEDSNNVLYAPNSPGIARHEDIAPFTTEKLWDLRWLGRLEYADNGILQTQFAAPDGSASLYRPERSSPLVGTTAGQISVVDLLGTPRSDTQTRGALEPEPEAEPEPE